jgi:hypothetical protein
MSSRLGRSLSVSLAPSSAHSAVAVSNERQVAWIPSRISAPAAKPLIAITRNDAEKPHAE